MPTASPTIAPSFDCPKCQKSHGWRSEFVNRVARCACGHVLRVPAFPEHGTPPMPPVPPIAAAAQATTSPPPLPPLPGASDSPQSFIPVAQMASVQIQPPPPVPPGPASVNHPFLHRESGLDELDPETERELASLGYAEEENPLAPNPTRDFHVPVGLLVLGLVLAVGQLMSITRGDGILFPAACAILIVTLILNVAMMLAGVVIAAKLASINFGPVGPAILKLCAAFIAPNIAGEIVTQALGGDMAVAMIGYAVSVVMSWGLLSYLFRLDGSQTAITVFTIWAVKFLAAMCVMTAILQIVGGVFSS